MAGKKWLVWGAVLGFGGVALGAFGAHGLQTAVKTWGLTPQEELHRLQDWEIAVRYQMYHAVALLAVGLLQRWGGGRWFDWAGAAFLLGVLIFSGCLYAYVFSGAKTWGLIVPIGGVFLLFGWLAMGIGIWRQAPRS